MLTSVPTNLVKEKTMLSKLGSLSIMNKFAVLALSP